MPRAAVELDRAGTDPEHGGDFGFWQSQPVAQHQHLAAPPGQPGHRGQHLPAVLGQQRLVLRGRLGDVTGHGVARAPEAARDGTAAQRAAAPVQDCGPDVRQRAVRVRQLVPGAQPGEHVLDDVLTRRLVPGHQCGQPDQFGVMRAEQRGHAVGGTARLMGCPRTQASPANPGGLASPANPGGLASPRYPASPGHLTGHHPRGPLRGWIAETGPPDLVAHTYCTREPPFRCPDLGDPHDRGGFCAAGGPLAAQKAPR